MQDSVLQCLRVDWRPPYSFSLQGKEGKENSNSEWKALNREGQYIQLLEIKQRIKSVADSPVLSIYHLVEEITKTRTKIQLWRLLLLSHSFQKESHLISPARTEHISLYYTASQKISENLKSVRWRIQPRWRQKNFHLFLTQVGAGNHKNSYYDTATAPSRRVQWHHYPRPGAFITWSFLPPPGGLFFFLLLNSRNCRVSISFNRKTKPSKRL